MSMKEVMYGVGGVLVGLVAGAGVGSSVSEGKIQDAISRTLTPAQEASAETTSGMQETLVRLEDRLGLLEQAMLDNRVDQAALTEEITSGVSGQIEGMQSALSTQISEASTAQTDAVKAAMSEVTSGMADSARIAAAAVASAGGGGGAEESAAVTAGAGEVSGAMGVGQTAIFADGDLRVFVSRLDPQAGSARLMVNRETLMLGTGGTADVSVNDATCALSVMALTEDGVTLASDCGTEEVAEAAEAANAPAETVSAEAPENGMRPGSSQGLADGKVRVFLSSVDETEGAVRVAVNGVRTETLAIGESLEAASGEETCTVTLAAIGQGQAGFDASCE